MKTRRGSPKLRRYLHRASIKWARRWTWYWLPVILSITYGLGFLSGLAVR